MMGRIELARMTVLLSCAACGTITGSQPPDAGPAGGPDAKAGTPDARSGSADARAGTPDARAGTPDAPVTPPPDARAGTPDARPTPPDAPVSPPPDAPVTTGPTVMRVDGRQLLDSTGAPFLTRGIEGWFGPNAQANMTTLVDGLASQGFNAVRLQLLTSDLSKIEPLIQRFHAKHMVVYLTDANMPGVSEWFGQSSTQAMIERNKYDLVIDATIEEPGDAENPGDVTAWLATQKAVITKFRNWGYTQPLTIGTPNAGRYLRGLLDHGQELIDHDPLHSLVLNCQIYWGAYSGSFSYQELSGFDSGDPGIRQATAAIAAQTFLIQLGLDAADSGGNWAAVPYDLLMNEAQDKAIGTMFWQWKDPGSDDPNSLVTDQLDPGSLTALGDIVINTHPASIKKTSKLAH